MCTADGWVILSALGYWDVWKERILHKSNWSSWSRGFLCTWRERIRSWETTTKKSTHLVASKMRHSPPLQTVSYTEAAVWNCLKYLLIRTVIWSLKLLPVLCGRVLTQLLVCYKAVSATPYKLVSWSLIPMLTFLTFLLLTRKLEIAIVMPLICSTVLRL